MTDHNLDQSAAPSESGKSAAATARQRAADATARARAKASETAERAKAKANEAADMARLKGRKAKENALSGVDTNPLVAIAGGIAVGAILAGLLPRTATEDRAVGKVGTRIRTTARNAVNSAKENAKSQLDELGLNADSAREKLGGLAGKVAKAASAVGTAAAESAMSKK
jgi:ElaB/YqjD/DUF883 family membrane-anchored ribosome-binding protein